MRNAAVATVAEPVLELARRDDTHCVDGDEAATSDVAHAAGSTVLPFSRSL